MWLASKSPRRAELLRAADIEFDIDAQATEELTDGEAGTLVVANAERKAAATAQLHPGDLVLGADTVIAFERRIIGKPRDLDDARAILRTLSGKTHEVYTGIALLNPAANFRYVEAVRSTVTFQTLSAATIERYIARVPVLDKAGAYAIQEHGDWIIASYTGTLDNIVGLPVAAVRAALAEYQRHTAKR